MLSLKLAGEARAVTSITVTVTVAVTVAVTLTVTVTVLYVVIIKAHVCGCVHSLSILHSVSVFIIMFVCVSSNAHDNLVNFGENIRTIAVKEIILTCVT